MDNDFIELFETMCNESLLKTEVLFATQKQTWMLSFAEHFQLMCADVVKLQNDSSFPEVARMEYTMLHTNFINRRYVAEVWIYDDDVPYITKNQRMIGEYDISFLFIYFDELWKKLLLTRKRYAGKVRAVEIKSLMMQAMFDFFSYVIKIVRYSIADYVNKAPFTDIVKAETFRILVGHDMTDDPIPVFTKSTNKDAQTLAEWFQKRLRENEYRFEDYSDLDFSAYFFPLSDFCFSHFRNSYLNNVGFEKSMLIGTCFYKAYMENCRLDNCVVYEADFSYAKLKGASFTNVYGNAGALFIDIWRDAGYLPVRFRYADLTNVNFKSAGLAGADFTGANLANADFTGAVLTNADFTDAILDGTIFDKSIGRSV